LNPSRSIEEEIMPYSAFETDEAIDEMFEADEADESDEAAPRRPWTRPRVATGQNLFRPRPETQYVTQAQLQAAMSRVGAQVRTNSTAITQLNTRVAAATATVKKETTDRKKDVTALRSNLSQTQQMSAILPLLSQPRSVTVTGLGADGIPDNTKVLVDGSNTLALLLPMLLMAGIGGGSGTDSTGGTSGGGGLFGGGDNNSMMMLAMILALGNR
jgi:hypothetical protein